MDLSTNPQKLAGKNVLITGAARRVGRIFALGVARAGANVVVHYHHSSQEVEDTCGEILALGVQAYPLQANLDDPLEVDRLVPAALRHGPLFALVNSAAIFEPLTFQATDLDAWNRHLRVNLTAPYRLSQAFAASYALAENGRIINILDWRALRPGVDHFPYTITKAALASMTSSLAAALAPRISVNGLALGAILPPSDGGVDEQRLSASVPAGRWARPDEVEQALVMLLTAPDYLTGEIIHLDGGRHLI